MNYSAYEPMHIYGTQYTLNSHSFEIYVAGCLGNPHCKGCHSPHTWDFRGGKPYTECLGEIESAMGQFNDLIENISVFGGEPLDQPETDMNDLMSFLKTFGKPIWLYTRYSLDEVSEKMPFLLTDCDYIKCGRYDEKKLTDDNIQYGIKLASSNQNIYAKGVDY